MMQDFAHFRIYQNEIKRSGMKHFLILMATVMLCATGWSQEYSPRNPLESNLMVGAGLFGETGNRARTLFPGAVLRLSYGLDIKLGEGWS